MFSEKTQALIDSLGAMGHSVAVITTMGVKYKDTHNLLSVFSLDDHEGRIGIISHANIIAKTGKYRFIIIDNIFDLYDTYKQLRSVVTSLSEIAKEYNIFIIT